MKEDPKGNTDPRFGLSVGERLKELRKQRGLNPEDLSRQAQIPIAWYYDLESKDEIYSNCPLSSVFRLCAALQVSPLSLFGLDIPIPPTEQVSSANFASRLASELQQHNLSNLEFAERSGWDIETILKDPSNVFELCVEAIREICDQTATLSWTATLQGLFSEFSTTTSRS